MGPGCSRSEANNKVGRIEWAYDHQVNDAARIDFIRSTGTMRLSTEERVQMIRWLREEVPIVKIAKAFRNASEWLDSRAVSKKTNSKLHTKVALSEEIFKLIQKLSVSCEAISSDLDSCPRSYFMSCSYLTASGKEKNLLPFVTYQNCE